MFHVPTNYELVIESILIMETAWKTPTINFQDKNAM